MDERQVNCIKLLVLVFTFLYFIAGFVLVITGAVIQADIVEYEDGFSADDYTDVPPFLIFVGVTLFIIASVGFWGAVKENFCLTMTYAGFLSLIFIFEISAGIAAYALKDDLQPEIREGMYSQMKMYNSSERVKETWDLIQHDLSCCGVNNATDWEVHGGFKKNQFPDSCCQKVVKDCGLIDANKFERGCLGELEDVIGPNLTTLGGLGVGFAFVQIIGVLLVCCLGRAIKTGK